MLIAVFSVPKNDGEEERKNKNNILQTDNVIHNPYPTVVKVINLVALSSYFSIQILFHFSFLSSIIHKYTLQ